MNGAGTRSGNSWAEAALSPMRGRSPTQSMSPTQPIILPHEATSLSPGGNLGLLVNGQRKGMSPLLLHTLLSYVSRALLRERSENSESLYDTVANE